MSDIKVYNSLVQLLDAVVPNDRVKTDDGDPISDYLDAKCDNTTVTVDTINHKLQIVPALLSSLFLNTKIRYASVSLTAGNPITVTFTSDIGSINYVLIPFAYRVDGSQTFPRLLTQTSSGFTLDVPDNCTLNYIAILI